LSWPRVSSPGIWYVASFGSYDATYGSLGAIFGFMTWLWIAAIIVIVGAEVNSEIEHQTRRDTTTGRPRPMGERGAVMADTIGPTFADAGAHAGAEAAPARRQSESLPIGRVALSSPICPCAGGSMCYALLRIPGAERIDTARV
jgi:hypothetical protein